MTSLRSAAAMALSAATFLSTTMTFAAEPTPETEDAPPPAGQEPAQRPPTSTTTTTAAPYYGTSQRVSERIVETRPNPTLLNTGIGLFILSYGGSVVAAAVSNRDEDKRLFIPIVGPWMNLAQRHCSAANPCGATEDVAKAMIITSGVIQGGGLLMAISSLFIPETTTVEERTTLSTKRGRPSFRIVPLSYGAGAGIGAVGRF